MGGQVISAGDRFAWRGVELDYFAHPYNRTAENERAVEVPIGRHFIEARAGDGLEVGNVLGHYGGHDHRVVDLYEEAPGVENVDLFDVTDTFDWILTISTIEHVRWEAPPWDPRGSIDAVAHLRSLLRPGGTLFVTAPFGQNPHLDVGILSGELDPDTEATLTFEGDHWNVLEGERVWRPTRKLRWAGAIWVASWSA